MQDSEHFFFFMQESIIFTAMKAILTITGSDSTGGAGIQADIKTINRLGGKVLSVITTLTMQNTLGIQDFYDIPAEVVENQINAVAEDIEPYVFKIGLIRNIYTLEAILRCIRRYHPQWVLFSPVIYSSNEDMLMDEELVEKIQQELVPLCHALVLRKRDSEHFSANRIIVAADNHGRSNELCSTIATLLCQEMTLDEAEKKARLLIPNEVNTVLSGRILQLYQEFMGMQEQECKNSNDVNYYASRLNVSPRYLSQVTRKVTEQSPKTIIDTTLLNRIKEELHSEKTVQEIAYLLGFSSQAHLTNFFKRFTGISPTEFRKFTHL